MPISAQLRQISKQRSCYIAEGVMDRALAKTSTLIRPRSFGKTRWVWQYFYRRSELNSVPRCGSAVAIVRLSTTPVLAELREANICNLRPPISRSRMPKRLCHGTKKSWICAIEASLPAGLAVTTRSFMSTSAGRMQLGSERVQVTIPYLMSFNVISIAINAFLRPQRSDLGKLLGQPSNGRWRNGQIVLVPHLSSSWPARRMSAIPRIVCWMPQRRGAVIAIVVQRCRQPQITTVSGQKPVDTLRPAHWRFIGFCWKSNALPAKKSPRECILQISLRAPQEVRFPHLWVFIGLVLWIFSGLHRMDYWRGRPWLRACNLGTNLGTFLRGG